MPFGYSFPKFDGHNSFIIKTFEELDEKVCKEIDEDLKTLRNIHFERSHILGVVHVISKFGKKYQYATDALKQLELYLVFDQSLTGESFLKLKADKGLDSQTIGHIKKVIEKNFAPCKSWNPGTFSVPPKTDEEKTHMLSLDQLRPLTPP